MSEETDTLEATSQPTTLLAPVRAEVIALNEDSPPELLLLVLGECKNYIGELKILQKLCEAAMIESIKCHGPIIVSPTIKYVVGSNKSTRCENVPAAVEAILGAVGGDFAQFCGVLSANALKHGQAKKILAPEKYAEFFKVTVKETLDEKESKPKEKLLRLDEQFVK